MTLALDSRAREETMAGTYERTNVRTYERTNVRTYERTNVRTRLYRPRTYCQAPARGFPPAGGDSQTISFLRPFGRFPHDRPRRAFFCFCLFLWPFGGFLYHSLLRFTPEGPFFTCGGGARALCAETRSRGLETRIRRLGARFWRGGAGCGRRGAGPRGYSPWAAGYSPWAAGYSPWAAGYSPWALRGAKTCLLPASTPFQ
jgi:hypothetical protein